MNRTLRQNYFQHIKRLYREIIFVVNNEKYSFTENIFKNFNTAQKNDTPNSDSEIPNIRMEIFEN